MFVFHGKEFELYPTGSGDAQKGTLSREIEMIKSLGKLFHRHTPTTPS